MRGVAEVSQTVTNMGQIGPARMTVGLPYYKDTLDADFRADAWRRSSA
jgi:hypothetical protein